MNPAPQDQNGPAQGRARKTTDGTIRLAALLAAVGGFLDAFTYMAHGQVFANAQTGNIVLLAGSAVHGDWAVAIRHVLPIAAFIAGIAAAETITHPHLARRLRWPRRSALILEITVLGLLGALPALFSNTAVILAVAFVAAIQSGTFGKLGTWSVATTMTTGNLRTATAAAYRALLRNDREAADRATAFGTVCLAFIVGAGAGAMLTRWLYERAALGACGLLIAALLLFLVDERRAPRSHIRWWLVALRLTGVDKPDMTPRRQRRHLRQGPKDSATHPRPDGRIELATAR